MGKLKDLEMPKSVNDVKIKSKILVVEDDVGLNRLIRKTLQREGYQTGQALNGKEAVARIKEDADQILLLDFFLPDMTGRQVIRALKEEKVEAPLIIMTGNGDEKIAVELMKLGVRDYIIKESGFIDNLPQVIRRVYNEIQTEKELARTEKALRESESTFRALVEAAPDSVTATDLEGKIIKISPMTKELHGYDDPNEILGKNAMELIAPEDRERAAINMKKTFEEGCVRNVEYKLLKKDGSTYAGEFSAALVRDGYGNIKGFIATVRDITERKEAERQIREKEEQFRDLFENANDLIQAVKPDGNFLYVNRAWKETLGYTDKEVKALSFSDIIHPDSAAHCQEIFKKVMAGESFNYVEASFKTKEGYKIDVEGSITTRYEEGKFLSTRAIFRNVTEHKKAEQEKQSLSEQLFQAEKMQAVGQLAGGIAHDFNNMLFAISGYAEMLQSQLNDAKMQSDVAVIIQAVKRAAELNKQLLAFAREGKQQTVSIDIHKIIHEVIHLLKHTIDKRITIKEELDAGQTTISGDPAQLQNALLNIAINARDAMPKGGTLSFATDVVLIDEKYNKQHPYELIPVHYLRITLSDTGTGMPQEVKKRIFEPFYTTKEVGKGTGMGLAAVYGTVKNHKGAINVYSEEGHGSVFNIYLPLAEKPAEKEITEHKVIRPKGTPTVLLVDDEELVRNTAQEMLKGLGYQVTCCKDGKHAVDYYKKSWENIDIVILDMIMPGLNGYDTFMAMRDINQDIKAILSSGFSDDEEIRKSLKEGVIVAIQKPFRISKLSQILTDVLNNKLTPRAMDQKVRCSTPFGYV